jgi:hypothetical protein
LIPSENVINFIEQIGFNTDDFIKSRDMFIKQLYLKRNKIEIEGRNEPHFTISWGERAKLEFDKKKVLAAVATFMEKSPQTFINQYNEAHGEQPMGATQMHESMIID